MSDRAGDKLLVAMTLWGTKFALRLASVVPSPCLYTTNKFSCLLQVHSFLTDSIEFFLGVGLNCNLQFPDRLHRNYSSFGGEGRVSWPVGFYNSLGL